MISNRPPARGRSSTGSTTPTAWIAASVADRGACPTRSGAQPSSINPTSTWSIADEVDGASHCSSAAVSLAAADGLAARDPPRPAELERVDLGLAAPDSGAGEDGEGVDDGSRRLKAAIWS
jgi:hypothetical protein